MQISYSPNTIQWCPDCKHLSVHFFNDKIYCIVCGWEKDRSLPPEIVVEGETYVLPDMKPNRKQRRRGRRKRG